jgi:glycosyltransferase involved in cell wall biosynthesis
MSSLAQPRVVLGLQGAQMPANAIRGIGRWSNLYVQSLVRRHPELVAAVSIDRRLPLPQVVQMLPEGVPVLVSEDRPSVGNGERLVFHAFSIFETLELARIWPTWAQDPAVGLVVTVYDMIPALFPQDYFRGAFHYLLDSRLRMAQQADAVIAISRQTGQDVSRLLGIDQSRIFVVPGEVSDRFYPYPAGRAAAHMILPEALDVEPDFILSIGNIDPRKNMSALIRAYACLPEGLRERHQLVLTCSQAFPEQLGVLRGFADDLGVADRLVLTSYVDHDTMALLYQSCHTMVYPSRYEGLGLPVIEAMCCGASTLVSNVGPLREIVHDPAARFEPDDVADIACKLRRVLEDPAFANRRRSEGISDGLRYRWERSDRPAQEAYRLAARRRP